MWNARTGYGEAVSTASVPTGVRRRPKDRKAQIARASAEAFSAQGYHAVSMETIAAKVGISAAALYRHYTGKYDLFRAAVLALSQQLVDCTDLDQPEEADPAVSLQRLVAALINETLDSRDSGGLYRWQARYLRAEDQAMLTSQLKLVNRRIQKPLIAIRPPLLSTQRWMLSAGVLSVIGSIVDHDARLPADDIRVLLAEVTAAIVAAELPQPGMSFPARCRGGSSPRMPGSTKRCCTHRWRCSKTVVMPTPAWPRSPLPLVCRCRGSIGISPASARSWRPGCAARPTGCPASCHRSWAPSPNPARR